MVVGQFKTSRGSELFVLGLSAADVAQLQDEGGLDVTGETGMPPHEVRLLVVLGTDDEVRTEMQGAFDRWIQAHQTMHRHHPEDN